MSDKVKQQVIVTCPRLMCHGNKNGICKVLAAPIKGKPCPFYKNELRLALELEALSMTPVDWPLYRKAGRIK